MKCTYKSGDRKTVSFFGGYNFTGSKFELYTEMEYLFELNDKTNSYYYIWTELTFAPKDWLWVGITGQRTRIYESNLGIRF